MTTDLFPESAPTPKAPERLDISSPNWILRQQITRDLATHHQLFIYGSTHNRHSFGRAFKIPLEAPIHDLSEIKDLESFGSRDQTVYVMPGAQMPMEKTGPISDRFKGFAFVPEAMLFRVEIRCISLHQPWATLMALRLKQWETRGWQTPWRGLTAIQSAKTEKAMEICQTSSTFRKALEFQQIPFGKILAVGLLAGCITTEKWQRTIRHGKIGDEYHFGNYDDGRHAWNFPNLHALDQPIPFSAQQGIFPLEQDAIDAITSQLPSLHLETPHRSFANP